jgi:hypothetical protein
MSCQAQSKLLPGAADDTESRCKAFCLAGMRRDHNLFFPRPQTGIPGKQIQCIRIQNNRSRERIDPGKNPGRNISGQSYGRKQGNDVEK